MHSSIPGAEPANEGSSRPIQETARKFVVIEPAEPVYRIEPLHDRHDRPAFSCGVEPLDHYLKTQAGQNLKKRVAAVFVATPDGKTIAGFYTLSAHLLSLGDLPAEIANKFPKYPNLPTTRLGRLAVSRDFRGQRLARISHTNIEEADFAR